jgi:hypothetical protein
MHAAHRLHTKYWGEAVDLDDVTVDWHVPNQDEVQFAYKVYCNAKCMIYCSGMFCRRWRGFFCLVLLIAALG